MIATQFRLLHIYLICKQDDQLTLMNVFTFKLQSKISSQQLNLFHQPTSKKYRQISVLLTFNLSNVRNTLCHPHVCENECSMALIFVSLNMLNL